METPIAEPARASVRRAWAPQEDQILQREAELQLQNGSVKDWKLIATKLPGRTNKDCRKRWSKICDSVNKGPWNHREDKLLEEAIAEVGPQWISVAKHVGTRHADQCAKRWRHFLDPDLDHSRWEAEDDTRLWAAVLKYGSNWRRVVEEEFPERSPTNVKNRYAVIKNLRRRGKDSVATQASSDAAGDMDLSSPQFTSGANDGGQTSTSANSNASTADVDSSLDYENAIYSAGALDDDFGLFLNHSLSPQTLPSSTISNTESLTTHANTSPAVEKQWLEGTNYDLTASLALEEFPQMEIGSSNNGIGNDARHGILWEPPNDHVTTIMDKGGESAIEEKQSGERAMVHRDPLSSDSAHARGESRRVSLFLEDMQPETANRVTSMLLNSDVDLKMKITVK